MSLYDEIVTNYTDGNGLTTPAPAVKGVARGSDNGPMYTAEFLIMLSLSGDQLNVLPTAPSLTFCVDSITHLLNRQPWSAQPQDQEGPDDYYGVLNYLKLSGDVITARGFLKALGKGRGCLNNATPGVWTWDSFLIRQPQLLCAMISAAYPGWSILQIAIRLLCFPLYLYTAIIVATACLGVDTGDADARRLSWHLQRTVRGTSALCWLASKLWYRRLYKDYGPIGMRAVAAIYYKGLPDGTPHPFATSWIN